MEFNKPITQNSDISLPDLSTEKVQLTSVERSTIKPINGTLNIICLFIIILNKIIQN